MSNAERQGGPSAFDPARFKEQERAGFNLVANRYEKTMSSIIAPVLTRLVELAQVAPGMAVLDVATGPGLLAREVARQRGPEGALVGVDIAEEALKVAAQEAERDGLGFIRFQVEDAEQMTLPDNSFDRALCSMGLMHFPAPERALAEMRRVLKPGGRMAACVWGEEQASPFIQVALATLARNFPPPKVERPSMFRLGQPETLARMVEQAGFEQVQTEPATVRVRVSDGRNYWQKFLDVAGITTVALAKQPPEMIARLEQDVDRDLAPYRQGEEYALDSSLLIVTGVKGRAG